MTSAPVLDVYCGLAALVSGVALGLRAYMLKPNLAAWQTSPPAVWLTLWLLSLSYLAAAAQLLFGVSKFEEQATAREAVIFTASAASAVVMLFNLARQAWTPKTGLEDDDEA